jgi:hypothetical protein
MTDGGAGNAWICWGQSDGGTSTSAWEHVIAIGGVTGGVAFSNLVTGLSTNTTYFYRCYAQSASGSDWSDAAGAFSGTPVGDGDAGSIEVSTTSGTDGVSGNVQGLNDSGFFGDTTFQVRDHSGTDYARKGYIRFDVSSLASTVTTATVSFTLSSAGSALDLNLYGLTDETQDNWDSATTTWSTAPANDTGSASGVIALETTLIATFSGDVAAGDVLSVSNQNLVDFLNADSNGKVTFILCRNGDGDTTYFYFAGDTHATYAPPHLAIETDLIPPAVANLAPTGISETEATLAAQLNASGTDYDVTVFYGTTDGGTNAGSWATGMSVGSWTNVSTNVSYAASGLAGGFTYYYTFMASNSSGVVWASPSWTFTTPGTGPVVTANHAVPHVWLDNLGLVVSNNYESAALADPDGDGLTTWEEYWTGTNPNDSDSFFKIDAITWSGSNLVLQWQHANPDVAVPDVMIWRTDELTTGTWINIGSKTPVDGLNQWSNAVTPKAFYRISITNAP